MHDLNNVPLFWWLPLQASRFLFVLFLSFLIGLERERQKLKLNPFIFGGVRTFPIIGLIGFSISYLTNNQIVPVLIGFVLVGAFLLVAYFEKVSKSDHFGLTSEMSGLVVYLVACLVAFDHLWFATAITIVCLLLLELKNVLENLANKLRAVDIFTFTKFLLLTLVILPIVPNQPFGPFEINPFKTWLIVVTVSGISYLSYLLHKGKGGIFIAAFLGGAYSSTVTTVAFARRSKTENLARVFSGATLVASGMMYLRLIVLLGLFNKDLMFKLLTIFLILGLAAIIVGVVWMKSQTFNSTRTNKEVQNKNPLEIKTALVFGCIFVAMVVITHFVVNYFGSKGLYTLSAIMGVTDVDPFIMSLTHTPANSAMFSIAANAILIATLSNNIVKGVYAYALGSKESGKQSLMFLSALSVVGLILLIVL